MVLLLARLAPFISGVVSGGFGDFFDEGVVCHRQVTLRLALWGDDAPKVLLSPFQGLRPYKIPPAFYLGADTD